MRPFNLQAERIMQNKPHAAVSPTARQGFITSPHDKSSGLPVGFSAAVFLPESQAEQWRSSH
jgi:hypothetical protein